MNKKELIESVALKTGLTIKSSTAALNAMIDIVQDEVIAGSKVQLMGFGTFGKKLRGERKSYNPFTKTFTKTKSSTIPYFKPGKNFKDMVKR